MANFHRDSKSIFAGTRGSDVSFTQSDNDQDPLADVAAVLFDLCGYELAIFTSQNAQQKRLTAKNAKKSREGREENPLLTRPL